MPRPKGSKNKAKADVSYLDSVTEFVKSEKSADDGGEKEKMAESAAAEIARLRAELDAVNARLAAVRETKTERIQLVLRPSTARKIRAKATEAGKSLNDFCHDVFDSL